MEKGIYYNQNSEIVYAGNRKPIVKDGFTWVDGKNLEFPAYKPLKSNGLYAYLFDDGNIILNQASIDLDEATVGRLEDIKESIENSGLRKLTVSGAHSEIDNLFEDARTPTQIKAATIAALKLVIVHLLK